MDLSNHILLPREDYIELQERAWDNTPMTAKDRAGSMLQTTFVLAACAGAYTAGVWMLAKSRDWLEERNFERKVRSGEIHVRSNPAGS